MFQHVVGRIEHLGVVQEGVDNALEQLEAEGGAVLLADGGQGGRVVAQRVKLGGGDVASRHIMVRSFKNRFA